MSVATRIDAGSMPGTFKVVVDGNPSAMLWIKWYSTTANTIAEPTLEETPYDDPAGTLVVEALRSPTFPYSTSDITMPANTRWVLAIAWSMEASNATLLRSSSTKEFNRPTTTSTSSSTSSTSTTSTSTTSTSTSTSSSTTESSTTGSSTTSSSTTASSTTSGSSGMATWTWQNMGGVNQWVLTTACSSGTASPPGFNGMMPGDTAQTSCS